MKYGCIYRISNSSNEKVYIGQTTAKNPNTRWMNHKQHAKHNYGRSCIKLVRAMRKYGIDTFSFEIMQYADSKDALDTLEYRYIRDLDTIKNGYNLKDGGSNGKMSEETKRKMSETQKRIGNEPPHDPVSMAKMAESKRGKPGPWKKGESRSMKSCRQCKVDGVLYPSVATAARALGLHKSTLTSWLEGKRKAKIPCEYLINPKTPKTDDRRGGIKNAKNAKPCILDGITYQSIRAASVALSIPKSTLKLWLSGGGRPKFSCEYSS